MKLLTAKEAARLQEDAMDRSKVKKSIFRKIRRSAKKGYGAKTFAQDELVSAATRVALIKCGYVLERKDSGDWSVKWYYEQNTKE
jgi:hypothetical protein